MDAWLRECLCVQERGRTAIDKLNRRKKIEETRMRERMTERARQKE